MTPPSPHKITTLLFNPFRYVAGGKALVLGVAAILGIGWLGSLKNVHFDGVISAHIKFPFPLWAFLAEGVIAWLCMAVVLLVFGKIFAKTSFRAIDVFGTQAMARWPSLFTALILLASADTVLRVEQYVTQLRVKPEAQIDLAWLDVAIVTLVIIAGILLICWMVYLMYKGYSVSCNIKGGRAVGTFIAALILAELLSQVAIGHGLQALVQHGEAAPALSEVQTTAPAMTALQTSGEQFADLLTREDFPAAVAQFNPTMKAALPEPALRKVWQDLLTQSGPFQKRLHSRTAEQSGFRVVLVTCQFERATLDMKIVFDANEQIAGLFFQ